MLSMSDSARRVLVEEVQWSGLFHWLALFRAFRMSIRPSRLLLSLFLVVLLFLGGSALDRVWNEPVYPGEFSQWVQLSSQDFRRWHATRDQSIRSQLYEQVQFLTNLEQGPRELVESPDRFQRAQEAIRLHYRTLYDEVRTQKQTEDQARQALMGTTLPGPGPGPGAGPARAELQEAQKRADEEFRAQVESLQQAQRDRLAKIRTLQPRGVFAAAMRIEIDALERLVNAAATFRLGLQELVAGQPHDPTTAIGALREMFVLLPVWLYQTHRVYSIIYVIFGTLLWSLFAGALTRMSAVHAATGERLSSFAGLAFAFRKWFWLLVAPLGPLAVVGLLSLVLMLGGLLFNLPGLDVLGGVVFGLAILLGLGITLLLAVLAAGASLLYPTIAVEGTDAFDAISRSLNYVVGRPWRWAFYNLVALVYGAVTYLFVGTLIFASLWVAHRLVGAMVFADAQQGLNRFEAIWPTPQFGSLVYEPDWAMLDTSGRIAAAIVSVWVYAAMALLAAYTISYVTTATTWVYLLLRRSADGTDMTVVWMPPAKAVPASSKQGDKVEPTLAASTTIPPLNPTA